MYLPAWLCYCVSMLVGQTAVGMNYPPQNNCPKISSLLWTALSFDTNKVETNVFKNIQIVEF